MLAESEVGARREANKKRMRSPLLTYVRGSVWRRNSERRCPVPVARRGC